MRLKESALAAMKHVLENETTTVQRKIKEKASPDEMRLSNVEILEAVDSNFRFMNGYGMEYLEI